MNMRALMVTVAGLGLTACGTTAGLQLASPQRIARMDTQELCDAIIYTQNRPEMIYELNKRALFADADMTAIHSHSVYVGMPADAARCSLGSVYGTRDLDIGTGPQQQWFYYDHSSAIITVKDGKVASYQN